MDTKEKVRGFIIDKIASVINGITDSVSKDMDFNNKEHMKLKDSLLRITDKQIDNLHKELEELFKPVDPEEEIKKYCTSATLATKHMDTEQTTDGVKPVTRDRHYIDLKTGNVMKYTDGLKDYSWEQMFASNANTEEHKDNPPPKKHKCSSGDRLDIVELKVKELDTILAKLLLLAYSHDVKVKEIEAEMPRLKRFAHSHFASELSL